MAFKMLSELENGGVILQANQLQTGEVTDGPDFVQLIFYCWIAEDRKGLNALSPQRFVIFI
jgi:hypothetical protein